MLAIRPLYFKRILLQLNQQLMKKTWFLLLAVLLLCGCARSTVEKRKKERYSAYAALPEDTRFLVDHGQIKVGMPMDAVYIAWGKPGQVIAADSGQGPIVTWIYQDTQLESYYYWTYRSFPSRSYYHPEPYLAHDYHVRPYVSAEVTFKDGVVKEWRTLPYPVR
jgi:hypothetical protein